MKKKQAFIILAAFQFLLILGHLTLKNKQIQQSYEIQNLEKQKQALEQQNNDLLVALAKQKNPAALKKYAKTHGMQKIRLSHLKQWKAPDAAT